MMSLLGSNAQTNNYSMVIELNNGSKVSVATNEVKQVTFANGGVSISGENIQTIAEKLDLMAQRIDSLANATSRLVAPQVRINPTTGIWEISNDGGKTWNSTGVLAQGPKGDPGLQGANGNDSPIVSVELVVEGTSSIALLRLIDGTVLRIPLIGYQLGS